MPKIKRFLALVCCLVVVVLAVPVQVHADPLTAGAAASIFQMWAQSYGMSVGGATFGFSGIDSAEANSWIADQFSNWQSYQVQHAQQETAMTISDFVASYGLYALTEKVYVGPNPSGVAYSTLLNIGSLLSEQLDSFWNWLLTDLGFTFDVVKNYWSNELFSPETPVELYSSPNVGLLYVSSNGVYDANWNVSAYAQYRGQNYPIYVSSNTTGTFMAFVPPTTSAPSLNASFIFMRSSANNGNTVYAHRINTSTGQWVDSSFSTWKTFSYNGNTYYYINNNVGSANPSNMQYKHFDSIEAAIAEFAGILDGTVDNTASTIDIETYADSDGDLDFPWVHNPYEQYVPQDVSIPISVPWDNTYDTLPQTEVSELVADQAVEQAIDNRLELAEEVDVPVYPDTDVIGPVGDYVVPGLGSVFPFCIPFDIYNFLSALASPPQAPVFSCTLAFPEAFGGPQTIELDFDTPVFNQLAQLLRLLELLAFIVGLAFVTRSMFIRG